jgi:hypothetical protein
VSRGGRSRSGGIRRLAAALALAAGLVAGCAPAGRDGATKRIDATELLPVSTPTTVMDWDVTADSLEARFEQAAASGNVDGLERREGRLTMGDNDATWGAWLIHGVPVSVTERRNQGDYGSAVVSFFAPGGKLQFYREDGMRVRMVHGTAGQRDSVHVRALFAVSGIELDATRLEGGLEVAVTDSDRAGMHARWKVLTQEVVRRP